MATEQDKTLDALRYAIQMEIDGKEYYRKASEASSNEMGGKLLASLSAEEDLHRQKFEEIYEALRSKKDWPSLDYQPDEGKALRTILARATRKASPQEVTDTELDAVQRAINMEVKSYDFYKSRSKSATLDAEREFYESLAVQERERQLVLLDYYEFLKNPAAWFVAKEHPSLDGG